MESPYGADSRMQEGHARSVSLGAAASNRGAPSGPAADNAIALGPGEMRGVHAGAIVFVAIAAANLGNYLFHFISARALGPGPYADVATLTAITALVALPLGGVQVFVARSVARYRAAGEHDAAARFARAALGAAAAAAVAITVLLVATSPAIKTGLSIAALDAVVLTALVAIPSVLGPVVLGLAQGLQRFVLFGASLAAGPVLRVGLVAVFVAAGFGVTGAMGATLLAMAAALALPLFALRDYLRRPPAAVARAIEKADVRGLLPVVAGLLAVTALSTDDVLVAKVVFDDHEAGIYAGASLIGRVILYLPAAVVTVLLPKVSARTALRRDSLDILTGSLVVTGVFCTLATLVYAAVPELVTRVAFGTAFAEAAPLLWLFAVAMSGFALLNVLLTYHLGRGTATMSWLLLGGAAVQAVGFVLFHESPRQLIAVSACVAAALLVVHEVWLDHSLVRTVRRLARR